MKFILSMILLSSLSSALAESKVTYQGIEADGMACGLTIQSTDNGKIYEILGFHLMYDDIFLSEFDTILNIPYLEGSKPTKIKLKVQTKSPNLLINIYKSGGVGRKVKGQVALKISEDMTSFSMARTENIHSIGQEWGGIPIGPHAGIPLYPKVESFKSDKVTNCLNLEVVKQFDHQKPFRK